MSEPESSAVAWSVSSEFHHFSSIEMCILFKCILSLFEDRENMASCPLGLFVTKGPLCMHTSWRISGMPMRLVKEIVPKRETYVGRVLKGVKLSNRISKSWQRVG